MVQIVKDTKYSWLVMAASLISMFVAGVLTYGSISVLAFVWADMYDLDADVAAWAPSVMGATFQLTGPVVVIVIHLIGTWKIQVLAAVITMCSSLATAFSTQYWHVILSYAVIQGTGASVLYLTSTEIVSLYFEKHRDKMYPAQALSFALAMIVTPSLLEYMIKVTSYKTAMIILAMPNLIQFPVAFVYRGPCKNSQAVQVEGLSGIENEANTIEANCELSDDPQNEIKPESEEQSILKNNDNNTGNSKILKNPSDVETEINLEKLEGDGNFEDVDLSEEATPKPIETRDKRSIITSHLYALKNWTFILYLFYFLVTSVGESTYYAFAVDFSVSLGILNLTEAALGMTLSGVSLCTGCLAMAILSHWQLPRLEITVGSAFVMGISLICVSLSKSLTVIYVCFIIYGFTEGVYIANAPSLIQFSFDGSEYMLIRLSYVFVMTGLGSLVGPVMTGYFAKSYGIQYLFYFLGAFPLTGSMVLLPYLICKKVAACRTPDISSVAQT